MAFRLAKRALPVAIAVAALAGPASAATMSRSEASLLRQMNNARTARHLAPLRADATLQRAARSHSVDMVRRRYFAHGNFALRMHRFHIAGSFAGENLAWGVGARAAARTIVAEWLASPEHRKNLLRPGFRRVGLATLVGSFSGYAGATVVTADFAGA
jgi:Uncharacterized protein with SCP/PR1 domains